MDADPVVSMVICVAPEWSFCGLGGRWPALSPSSWI